MTETLEEAVNKYWKVLPNLPYELAVKEAMKKGAKWQAERMYSEEEVLELIWKYETRKTSMVGYDNVKKWFEQHKKK